MSSILKALKKLENETGQQTSLADSVDTKKTIRRSTMGTWLFYSVISALVTIGILIGGGWILLRQKPMIAKWLHSVSSEEKKEIPKPEPVKENKPAPDIVRSEPILAKAPEIPKPPEPLKESVEKKLEPPKPPVVPEQPIIVPKIEEQIVIPIVIPPRPAPSRIMPDPPPPSPPADISKLTEAEMEAEIQRELEKAGATEAVPEAEIPPPPAATSSSQASEKQVEGLTIQALVWSEDPKSRMVMMNNQILHIGDTIDRYHIKEIGNDFVLLQEGSQELKMKFLVK